MPTISHLTPCRYAGEKPVAALKFTGSSTSFRNGARQLSQTPLRRVSTSLCIRASLVDDKLVPRKVVLKPSDILAYNIVQGALVRWSYIDRSAIEPPTAVLLHGILGSRKNWGTFARRLAQEFPHWQFLLVDLRCHGDSALIKKRGPNTVSSAALDVLKLVCIFAHWQ